jgi:hypothetical protein
MSSAKILDFVTDIEKSIRCGVHRNVECREFFALEKPVVYRMESGDQLLPSGNGSFHPKALIFKPA